MNRPAALLLVAVVLVGSVSALPGAATAASSTALQADADLTAVSPGQRLAGVIGAGRAEFEGEVERREYGIAYALAATNASKAAVIAQRLERVRERLTALEQREQALRAARENGSMSDGEYRARVTALAARSAQLEQLANASEARARALPAAALESKGVNVTAIRTLRQRAGNLTGPEVAAIARSIAGPGVGRPVGAPELSVPDAAPQDPADAANTTTDDPGQGNEGEGG